MANSGNRILGILIGLVAGAVIGFVWGRSAGVRDGETRATHAAEERLLAAGLGGATAVYIGPTSATATPENLPISFSKKNVVYWKPWVIDGSHTVQITFLAKDFPPGANHLPPFEKGKPNQDQAISCGGETCFSYAINPDLGALFEKDSKLTLDYKYIQTLDGKDPHDGHIIIVKP